MFIDIAIKPACLICGANVAAIEEFNLTRHFETKHQDKLKTFNVDQKIEKVEELKENLTSQQMFSTSAKTQSEEKWSRSWPDQAGHLPRESF